MGVVFPNAYKMFAENGNFIFIYFDEDVVDTIMSARFFLVICIAC